MWLFVTPRYLSPVSTVSARNAWDHDDHYLAQTHEKRVAFLESRSAKASLTNKHLIFSSSYQLWLIRSKAFFRHCIPHLISLNDSAIVRNFCAKKFHPWCKSKKLSKDLRPTWWRQICIGLPVIWKGHSSGQWWVNEFKMADYLHARVTLKSFANALREISSHSGLKKGFFTG